MRKYNTIFFGALFILLACDDQNSHQHIETFVKRITPDWPTGIIQTADSGYAICTGGAGLFLIRTNSHGDTLWTKFFPDGYATAMTRMPNGDFVIGGGITNMDQDILFLRLDSNGNKVWQSSFDGIGRDNVLDVSGLTDGSCVATGYFNSETQMFVTRVDNNGDTVWCRLFPGDTAGRSIILTSDNKITVAGRIYTATRGNDILIAQFDLDGNLLFLDSIGTMTSESGRTIRQTTDEFLIAGGASTNSYVYKTSASFDTLWTTPFTGYVADMTVLPDNGFIIIGPNYTNVGIAATLTRFSGSGTQQWQRILPLESGTRVIQSIDGGIVLVGLGIGGGYIIKANQDGKFNQ